MNRDSVDSELLTRFGDNCILCTYQEVFLGPRPTTLTESAHIRSTKLGGRYTIDNIVPLCPNHHRCFDIVPQFDRLLSIRHWHLEAARRPPAHQLPYIAFASPVLAKLSTPPTSSQRTDNPLVAWRKSCRRARTAKSYLGIARAAAGAAQAAHALGDPGLAAQLARDCGRSLANASLSDPGLRTSLMRDAARTSANASLSRSASGGWQCDFGDFLSLSQQTRLDDLTLVNVMAFAAVESALRGDISASRFEADVHKLIANLPYASPDAAHRMANIGHVFLFNNELPSAAQALECAALSHETLGDHWNAGACFAQAGEAVARIMISDLLAGRRQGDTVDRCLHLLCRAWVHRLLLDGSPDNYWKPLKNNLLAVMRMAARDGIRPVCATPQPDTDLECPHVLPLFKDPLHVVSSQTDVRPIMQESKYSLIELPDLSLLG